LSTALEQALLSIDRNELEKAVNEVIVWLLLGNEPVA
jgi:hypothetical protein